MKMKFFSIPGSTGGGSGITSINSDTTAAQVIAGANNVGVSTSGGTTTVDGVLLAPKASPTFTGTVKYGNYVLNPGETSDSPSAGAVTCDFSVNSAHSLTVVANTTFTLSNPQTGGAYFIRIIQDATGGWTYTWPGTVKWPSGVAPIGSGANKIDLVSLYWDGTSYYGTFSGNY